MTEVDHSNPSWNTQIFFDSEILKQTLQRTRRHRGWRRRATLSLKMYPNSIRRSTIYHIYPYINYMSMATLSWANLFINTHSNSGWILVPPCCTYSIYSISEGWSKNGVPLLTPMLIINDHHVFPINGSSCFSMFDHVWTTRCFFRNVPQSKLTYIDVGNLAKVI